MDKALELHKALVEAAAENDEGLMEKFFESESLTEDEMREGIRKGLVTRSIFPVFCVCAGKSMGVHRLMEFLGNVVPLLMICLNCITLAVRRLFLTLMVLKVFISSRRAWNLISVK